MPGRAPSAPRCAAIVGPYSSGKTSLLESLLHVTGALSKKGTAKEKTLLGDSSAEARARGLSVETTAAQAEFLGERWTFLGCPGAVELSQDMRNAVLASDVAIVVAEPQTEKALTLAPIFKFLDDNKIPHILFVNKMDTSGLRVRDVMESLQAVSSRPLVLRQVPIREEGKNGDVVAGYVDLVSERAYRYHPGQPSDLVKLPDDMMPREQEAREQMLEHLADFDDQLLEQLLSDAVPSKEAIYQQLSKDLAQDLIVPVLMGAAEQDYGVRRLLKALRHDVPGPEAACARLGLGGEAIIVCHVLLEALRRVEPLPPADAALVQFRRQERRQRLEVRLRRGTRHGDGHALVEFRAPRLRQVLFRRLVLGVRREERHAQAERFVLRPRREERQCVALVPRRDVDLRVLPVRHPVNALVHALEVERRVADPADAELADEPGVVARLAEQGGVRLRPRLR